MKTSVELEKIKSERDHLRFWRDGWRRSAHNWREAWMCVAGAKATDAKGEWYYSNNGRGPGTARIIGHINKMLILERRGGNGINKKHPVVFTLPERFFHSDECGWKKRGINPK